MADVRPITVPVNLVIDVELVGSTTNFEDVGDFHRKFGLPASDIEPGVRDVSVDTMEFRLKFLQEELDEIAEAMRAGDIAGIADGLVDLVYVAMGTAHFFGFPWQELWDEVHRANMTKVRANDAESSKRHHHFDVIKPEGWTPPDIVGVLAAQHGAGGEPSQGGS